MITFELDSPYIELIKLLKITRIAASGAEAKALVDAGEVSRNGCPESRKRAKIVKGERITARGTTIEVV
jgi:ribosome-associated protein